MLSDCHPLQMDDCHCLPSVRGDFMGSKNFNHEDVFNMIIGGTILLMVFLTDSFLQYNY